MTDKRAEQGCFPGVAAILIASPAYDRFCRSPLPEFISKISFICNSQVEGSYRFVWTILCSS